LTLGLNNTVTSEVTWNNVSGASGGGISGYFARPTWQTGQGVPTGSTRLVPDVSCTADPFYGAVLILNGQQVVVGGTSWSSPCWAAFNALINQSRANVKVSAIGLITPYLYPLLGSSNFRDITSGNNDFDGAAGYNAGTGYDLATGIGVPNVQSLAQALISPSGSPVFSNGPPPAVAGLNVGYSFTFTTIPASGVTFSRVSGNLPTGLSLSSSGTLSGTPSALGTFTATIQASNGIGSPATQTFTIQVENAVSPVITNGPPTATALYNNFYSFTYTCNGAPSPTLAVGSGSLPAGLTLSSSGVLSGVPTATGVFTGTVTASNGIGTPASQSFTITVQRAPYFLSSPLSATTTVNTSFAASFSVVGYPSPTFSISQGSLPPGININASNGSLSGTSTQVGTYTGTITANNGIAPNANLSFTINVIPLNAPTFLQPNLSLVTTINSKLNFSDKVTSNPTSTFGLVSGSLPPGLTLSSAGVISGTVTKTGIYSGVIAAQNGISPNGSQTFSITVLNNFVSQYSTLHSFGGGGTPTDGKTPWNSLVQGKDGNLYGTALFTGSTETGVVFQLSPQGTYKIIHSFQDGSVPNDGRGPQGGLIFGTDGNLYGTTVLGGTSNNGTLFKMTTSGVETILYNFQGQGANDGANPVSALVQGQDGTLYGTTDYGGVYDDGTVFKSTLQGQVTILHSFAGGPGDGRLAAYSPVIGPDQNIYGTTPLGGTASGGILFKVTPQGTYTILHNFGDGSILYDGTSPDALSVGLDGNLYGTTFEGGATNYGTVYKMTLTGTETILHNFNDGSTANDGDGLNCGLFQADDGNFYGAASYGGSDVTNYGTIFRMTPMANRLTPPC
jgi:uncharacterized repeat protein (TIGR03803 family)